MRQVKTLLFSALVAVGFSGCERTATSEDIQMLEVRLSLTNESSEMVRVETWQVPPFGFPVQQDIAILLPGHNRIISSANWELPTALDSSYSPSDSAHPSGSASNWFPNRNCTYRRLLWPRAGPRGAL